MSSSSDGSHPRSALLKEAAEAAEAAEAEEVIQEAETGIIWVYDPNNQNQLQQLALVNVGVTEEQGQNIMYNILEDSYPKIRILSVPNFPYPSNITGSVVSGKKSTISLMNMRKAIFEMTFKLAEKYEILNLLTFQMPINL
jgi:hypothetical protein